MVPKTYIMTQHGKLTSLLREATEWIPLSHHEHSPFRLKTLTMPNRNVRQNLRRLRCSKMPENKI